MRSVGNYLLTLVQQSHMLLAVGCRRRFTSQLNGDVTSYWLIGHIPRVTNISLEGAAL